MTNPLIPQRIRYALRFRQVSVIKKEQVYPNFLHITFAGEDLAGFESQGFDDHIKLLFPDPETKEIILPVVTDDGIQWPDNKKPLARDFTPLIYDPANKTLVIAFAIHGNGPAIEWARQCQTGDQLVIGGPRGSFIVPHAYDWHLLIGDETAFPAIARRIHELPDTAKILTVLETATQSSRISLDHLGKKDLTVVWVCRDQFSEQEKPLLSGLGNLSIPATGTGYIWAACEAESAKMIRDYLKERQVVPAKNMRISAYWKKGVADSHDTLET